MISFRNITTYNYDVVVLLDPGEGNLKYVPPIWMSMLSAHYINNYLEMKAIYNNKILIGFFMLTSEIKPVYLDCFIIDKKYQNKGFGNKCIQKIIRYIKSNYRINKFYLSTSNPIAFHLYEKNGFHKLNNKMADKYKTKYNEFLLVYKLKKLNNN
jgi:diamine N-acetyltransferase